MAENQPGRHKKTCGFDWNGRKQESLVSLDRVSGPNIKFVNGCRHKALVRQNIQFFKTGNFRQLNAFGNAEIQIPPVMAVRVDAQFCPVVCHIGQQDWMWIR